MVIRPSIAKSLIKSITMMDIYHHKLTRPPVSTAVAKPDTPHQ